MSVNLGTNAMNPIGLAFVVMVGLLVTIWFGRIFMKMRNRGFFTKPEA